MYSDIVTEVNTDPLIPLHKHHPILQERYDALRASYTHPSDLVVSFSGRGASGTSSHAAALSDVFNVEHVDNGAIQRSTAEQYGYPDAETFRAKEPDADPKTDAAKLERAFSGEPLIAEGRLDGAALCADRGDGEPIAPIRIKMIVPDEDIRAARYAAREDEFDAASPDDVSSEDLAAARRAMQERDETVYNLFAEAYNGFDPRPNPYYTHLVDNTYGEEAVHTALVQLLSDHGFAR